MGKSGCCHHQRHRRGMESPCASPSLRHYSRSELGDGEVAPFAFSLLAILYARWPFVGRVAAECHYSARLRQRISAPVRRARSRSRRFRVVSDRNKMNGRSSGPIARSGPPPGLSDGNPFGRSQSAGTPMFVPNHGRRTNLRIGPRTAGRHDREDRPCGPGSFAPGGGM